MEEDLKLLTEICQDLRIEKFDSLSKYTQNELVKALPKGNETVMSLYISHKFSGKIKLTHLSCASVTVAKKGEKTIIIIGEYHIPYNKVGTCPKGTLRPPDFLERLFRTTKVPIDFFLETNEIPCKQGEGDISQIRYLIQNCLAGRKCQFSAVRGHYTDLRFHYNECRRFPTIGYAKSKGVEYEEGFISKMKKEYGLLIRKDYLKKIRKQISNIQNAVNKKNVEDLYRSYIEWEEDFMIDNFRDFYEEMQRRLKFRLVKIRETTISYIGAILPHIEKDVISFQRDFVRLSSIYWMDVGGHVGDLYGFARMFRTFRKDENGKMFPFSIEPRNIIFYGGDAHAERMKGFAQKLGFDIQELKREPTKGEFEDYPFCVEIPPGTFFGMNSN